MIARGATFLAAVAVLVGCGAGSLNRPVRIDRLDPSDAADVPAGESSPPVASVAELDIVAAVFRPVGATPGARAFDVAWETGKCQFFHSLEVVERPDAVLVTVRERVKADSLCPDAGIKARRRVDLAAPLGPRVILNGGGTPPFPAA